MALILLDYELVKGSFVQWEIGSSCNCRMKYLSLGTRLRDKHTHARACKLIDRETQADR